MIEGSISLKFSRSQDTLSSPLCVKCSNISLNASSFLYSYSFLEVRLITGTGGGLTMTAAFFFLFLYKKSPMGKCSTFLLAGAGPVLGR